MKIFLTGSTGFVGLNFITKFNSKWEIRNYVKNSDFQITEDIVINFAGKAHDLKNVSNPQEYYDINTDFSNRLFDAFLESNASTFITISSVKAVADYSPICLTEDDIPNPITHYGKSKLLAEKYILSKPLPAGKRFYILRPSMIHGPGNKGNLSLLVNLVSKGYPWPLGAFDNFRSFCSIENLMFALNELIERSDVPSGIYNICDDIPLSTNFIIGLIAKTKQRNPRILSIPKSIVMSIAKLGDVLGLPLTSERLEKLTSSYIVSNNKIRNSLGKSFPVSSSDGLVMTFNSIN